MVLGGISTTSRICSITPSVHSHCVDKESIATAAYVDDVLVHAQVAQQLHLAQYPLGVRQVIEHLRDLFDGYLAASQLRS